MWIAVVGCDSSGSGMEENASETGIDVQAAAEAARTAQSETQKAFSGPDKGPCQEMLEAVRRLRATSRVDTVVTGSGLLSVVAVLDGGVPMLVGNNRPTAEDSLAGTSAQACKKLRNIQGVTRQARPRRASLQRAHPRRARPRRTSPRRASAFRGGAERLGARVKAAQGEGTFVTSRKAVVASYDGGAAQASKVEQKLSEAGFNVRSLGTSLTDMRQYKNLGVLYLDTHGAAYVRIANREGTLAENTYGLETSTKVTSENLADFIEQEKRAFADGRLILSQFQQENSVGNTISGIKVAVTGKFIRKHWSFSKGSFALIHACRLADSLNGGPPRTRQAILEDAGAGALMAFKGKTNTDYAQETIVSAIDMLLGTARTKFGRPWSLPTTEMALEELGLSKFAVPGWHDLTGAPRSVDTIEVVIDGRAESPLRLVPSTRRMEVVDDAAEPSGTLRIKGAFPSKKGKVLLGSNQLSVRSWSQSEIVAEVPFNGAASSGPVRVDASGGTRGNRVALTKWSGSLSGLVKGAGTQLARSTGTIVFRGDLHPTRKSPTAAPTLPKQVEAYVSPASKMS
ncbi:MAG: hypothetical protein ABEL97_05470, partial [Salinibacter sp.]